GHGGVHESPKIMLVPLVLLAILSVVGGWIGVPGSLGGSNRFDKFLGPVFRSTLPTANAGEGGSMAPSERAREGEEPKTGAGKELLFTGISVIVALAGFGLAWQLYYKNPQIPQQIAHSLGGFYNTVLHKYYVDEIYAAVFIKPLMDGSTKILWH